MFEKIEDTSRAWLKNCEYQLCRSVEQMREYLHPDRVRSARFVGQDLEANSKNIDKARIVCATFSLEPGKALFYPVAHKVGSDLNLPIEPLLEKMQEISGLEDVFFVGWNYIKYDCDLWLRTTGWMPPNERCIDAMFAVYLENPNHKKYGLKEVIPRMFAQVTPIEYEDVAKGRPFDLVHPEDGLDYGCQDADFSRRALLLPKVQAAVREQDFIYKLEHMVAPEVREGEKNKVYLDKARLQELRAECDRRVGPLLAQIYELAGGEFKVDSPAVLGPKLLSLGVPIKEQTGKTKQPETKKEILEKYKSYHPIIEPIIQYKELTTQTRNYIDKMIAAVEYFGPLVKFPFHQVGVPTGRMKAGGEGSQEESYEKGVVNVNIQSTPDHEKKPYLPNIRAAIVANDPATQVIPPGIRVTSRELVEKYYDFVIVAVDYSQVELRIAANLSREPAWIKTFSEGGDIHLTNAKLAYRDYKMTDEDPRRKRGKTMSFAILYGGDEYTVANHGSISVEQGKMLVENFFGGAPELKKWIDSWIKAARYQKFVKTYFGRKRPLDEFYIGERPTRETNWLWRKGDREAVNDPIQGGAADIFKLGMVKLGKLIRAKGWQQDVLQTMWIHDEFVLRVRTSMLEQVIPEIVRTLEFDVKGWPVKLKVDVEVGPNWGEKVKWKHYLESGFARLYKEEKPLVSGDVVEEEPETEETPSYSRSDYGY